MTRDVVIVSANQQMSTAVQELIEHNISGVPVVSYERRCVGILSCKDFLTLKKDDVGDEQVLNYMTSPPITISENHTLLDVASILRHNNIQRVPVVDERGRITGILSTRDIVDHTIRAMNKEIDSWY